MSEKSRIAPPPEFLQRCGITRTRWKQKKRAELRRMSEAFEEYRNGAAFCPGYETATRRLFEALNEMKILHAPGNWR